MFNTEDWKKKTGDLKEQGKIITNSMLMGEELKEIAGRKESVLLSDENGGYIVCPEENHSRLHFAVLSDSFPGNLLAFLGSDRVEKPCVFDLLGRTKTVRKNSELLENEGLSPYARYNRYTLRERKTPKGMYQSLCTGTGIQFGMARDDDCLEIVKIFQSNFDGYTSNVPFSAEAVAKHIQKNEICVARHAGVLAAAFCFEILDDHHVHLNVVASSDEYESMGLAMILYEYVLDLFEEDTVFICWIEENNQPSIEMHQALGFEEDTKMCFHIFVYTADQ